VGFLPPGGVGAGATPVKSDASDPPPKNLDNPLMIPTANLSPPSYGFACRPMILPKYQGSCRDDVPDPTRKGIGGAENGGGPSSTVDGRAGAADASTSTIGSATDVSSRIAIALTAYSRKFRDWSTRADKAARDRVKVVLSAEARPERRGRGLVFDMAFCSGSCELRGTRNASWETCRSCGS
jgi:hypothetical protein